MDIQDQRDWPSLTSSLDLRLRRTENHNVELLSAVRSRGEEPDSRIRKDFPKEATSRLGRKGVSCGQEWGTGQAVLQLTESKEQSQASAKVALLGTAAVWIHRPDNQPHHDMVIHPACLTLQNNTGPPLRVPDK